MFVFFCTFSFGSFKPFHCNALMVPLPNVIISLGYGTTVTISLSWRPTPIPAPNVMPLCTTTFVIPIFYSWTWNFRGSFNCFSDTHVFLDLNFSDVFSFFFLTIRHGYIFVCTRLLINFVMFIRFWWYPSFSFVQGEVRRFFEFVFFLLVPPAWW